MVQESWGIGAYVGQVFIIYGNVCAVRRLQDMNGMEEALEEVTDVALTYARAAQRLMRSRGGTEVITFPGHQGEVGHLAPALTRLRPRTSRRGSWRARMLQRLWLVYGLR